MARTREVGWRNAAGIGTRPPTVQLARLDRAWPVSRYSRPLTRFSAHLVKQLLLRLAPAVGLMLNHQKVGRDSSAGSGFELCERLARLWLRRDLGYPGGAVHRWAAASRTVSCQAVIALAGSSFDVWNLAYCDS